MRSPTALAALLLAACTGSVETSPGATGGTAGAGGAGCAPSCGVTIEGWTPAGTLLKPRQEHATFVVETPAGAFLYVAGGQGTDGGIQDVERAAIHDDGTLGPFAVVATLPGYSYAAGLAQAGRGVVLAGSKNSISEPLTYVGVVADDGSIGFTAGPPLGVTRHALTASAHGGFVYAIGGVHQVYDDMMENTIVSYSTAIERAPFDGATLGPWAPLDPLPQPIADHAAVVAGDAVYLFGGRVQAPEGAPFTTVSADVLRAPFSAGGALGAFAWAGAFVSPRSDMAVSAVSGDVFSVGGQGDLQGDDVLRASLGDDGTLGAFDPIASLPEAVSVRQAPVRGSFVYVAGGSDAMQAPRSAVLVGKLGAAPPQKD